MVAGNEDQRIKYYFLNLGLEEEEKREIQNRKRSIKKKITFKDIDDFAQS